MTNLICNTDSYKPSHCFQLPPDMTFDSRYIEPRIFYPEVLFFGPQMFYNNFLSKPITKADIEEADFVFALHGIPFNKADWYYILDKWGGYLPIEISSVDEGTVLPSRNVFIQVKTLDPRLPWVAGYIETALLRACWYPTTIATRSRDEKKILKFYMLLTCDALHGLDYKVHDMGARGCTVNEQTEIGGTSHFPNFKGSDSLSAIFFARKNYQCAMPAFSIHAMEHGTIGAWGDNNESGAIENFIDKFLKPGKTVAAPMDTYDHFNCVKEIIGKQLKDKIVSSDGCFVARCDSGDPVETPIDTIKELMNIFGFSVNKKDCKILPPCIRVLQSDKVDRNLIDTIGKRLVKEKISFDNLSFGQGGDLLNSSRDYLGWSMKSSEVIDNGEIRDCYKSPIGESFKKSRRGELALTKGTSGYYTVRKKELPSEFEDLLKPVWRIDELIIDHRMEDIRERCAI